MTQANGVIQIVLIPLFFALCFGAGWYNGVICGWVAREIWVEDGFRGLWFKAKAKWYGWMGDNRVAR